VSVRIDRQGQRLRAETADGSARLRGEAYPGSLFACGEHEGSAEGLTSIAGALREEGLRVISTTSDANEPWNRALLAAGHEVCFTKLLVRRELGDLGEFDCPFDWRTLAEVGDDEFRLRLEQASEGEPTVDAGPRDTDREWRELLEYAGERLDRTLWRVALLDGEEVGVVLPQTFGGDPPEGTLFHVGVFPPHRGQGLGRLLHRAGLHLLAGSGNTRYVGSTDTRNEAMARVFAANGCEIRTTQVYFRPGG
jgi:RimJ/RimL family protein N-acetyltransferase